MTGAAHIYLDYAASTPVDPRVAQAMIQWLTADAANPASPHLPGRRAGQAVEQARTQVAALIGAAPREIIWTSGATEANNLALKGSLGFNSAVKGHLLTARTEHKSVVDTARWLEKQGHRVTWLDVDSGGLVNPETLDQALQSAGTDASLVSLMWVNNETGVIQNIPALAEITRRHGVSLHVDASQAAGRVEIDLSQVPVDLLSLSAHKLGGPAGVGALYVCSAPRARLAAQMHGGGHERGLRSGTLAVHQCVGMGAACKLAGQGMADEQIRLAELRDRLWQGITSIDELWLNGAAAERAAAFLNVSVGSVCGESLLAELMYGEPALAVSSGSACTTATSEPSYVLRALGRSDELARASIRFSLGRDTTGQEIDEVTARVVEVVRRLRRLSPLTGSAERAVQEVA